jgi:hypothetical protein
MRSETRSFIGLKGPPRLERLTGTSLARIEIKECYADRSGEAHRFSLQVRFCRPSYRPAIRPSRYTLASVCFCAMLELTFDRGASLCDAVRHGDQQRACADNSWGRPRQLDADRAERVARDGGTDAPGKAEVRHLHRNVRRCTSSQRGTVCTIGKSSCLPVMLSTSGSGRRISFATTRANRYEFVVISTSAPRTDRST